MKKIFLILVSSTFLLTACGGSSDESEEYEGHGDGSVSSSEKNTNTTMLEAFINEVDRVDDFDADWQNAEVTKSPKVRISRTDQTEYDNIYIVDMDFTLQNKIESVRATPSWETDEPDGSATHLSYSSTLGGSYTIETDYKE